MSKLIFGTIAKDGQKPERFFFPSDAESLTLFNIPEKYHKDIKQVIETDIRSGLSGYGTKEYFKFTKTDFDYYRFMNFMHVYYVHLEEAHKVESELYINDLGATYSIMKWAVADQTFSKDSATFKKTCKQLGIKHTYKAINAYLKGE